MDWQPIETAPKNDDGSEIIVYCPREPEKWRIHMAEWGDDGRWHIHNDGPRIDPSHWMPLPDPPRD